MLFSAFPPVLESLPVGTGSLRLFGIPCLEDNLAWGLADSSGRVLLVDVPESAPVERFLRQNGLRLESILITHGHRDHTGGLQTLLRSHPAVVYADPQWALSGTVPLPCAGRNFTWNGFKIRVIDTSGHSECDRSFYVPDARVCFCGDTLFAGGCGRLFAGPPARMWASLLRLRALPDDTFLCFGHDYALENYRFASECFPACSVFGEMLKRVEACGRKGQLFAPDTVGEQSRSNPMLMADHADLAEALGMPGAPPAEVFAEIRRRRSAV